MRSLDGQRAAAALLALVSVAGAARAAEIQALDGTYRERIRSIRDGGSGLVVQTAERTLPLDSIKSIEFQPAPVRPPRSALVILVGGDRLRGEISGGNADALTLKSSVFGEIQVSLEQIRAVVPEQAPADAVDALATVGAEAELDAVILTNEAEVLGTVARIDDVQVVIDTRKEMVGEGATGIGVREYSLDEVRLISVLPLDDPPPPPAGVHVVVRTVDGSVLRGVPIELQEGRLSLKHPLGDGKPLLLPLARVATLTVQNGRVVYLSDLEPTRVEERFPPGYTYEAELWHFRRDENVARGPLRLGGRDYAKGIGVHSYSALTYALNGALSFRAVVGLDDHVRFLGEPGFGGVVFKILVDGKPAREYPSGLALQKGDAPKEVLVDLSGARELTLIADLDPASLHVLGRADWADAHLVRSR